MLTAFGRALRKLRIDRGLLLKEMAERLSMTSAFLSSVETGRKAIPDGLVARICEAYDLKEEERVQLSRAAAQSIQEIRMKMPNNASEADREALSVLARTFGNMTDDEKTRFRDLILRRRA